MKYITILLCLMSFTFAQEQDWDLQRGYDYRGLGEETEVEQNAIITCLVNHPQGYNCDYGKTTIESYEHRLQRIDAEYDRLHPREREITVGDYLDYAEECYNDSTWVETSFYMRTREIFSHYSWYREEGDVIWLRRTPTFEGFIEWLKEKKQ